DAAAALLLDYVDSGPRLHTRRHARSGVLKIVAEGPWSALEMLELVREYVLSSEYPCGLYGYVEALEWWEVGPAIRIDGRVLYRNRSRPGSLFARCRFILLKVLEEAALEYVNDDPAHVPDDLMARLGEAFGYYMLTPGISLVKESTSFGARAAIVAVALVTLTLVAYVGPLAASLASTVVACDFVAHGLVHGAIHSAVHTTVEAAAHGVLVVL
ncbi:MAG: hypothetical protein K0U78_20610, partial [Actinomycetia bacterium]|nr:hypothetical protein [Actinomycetes bacterium]